jgi:hypothetical protein
LKKNSILSRYKPLILIALKIRFCPGPVLLLKFY